LVPSSYFDVLSSESRYCAWHSFSAELSSMEDSLENMFD
jgi:hypothetical protein